MRWLVVCAFTVTALVFAANCFEEDPSDEIDITTLVDDEEFDEFQRVRVKRSPRPDPRGARRKKKKKKKGGNPEAVGALDTNAKIAKPGDKTLYDAQGNVLMAYAKPLNNGGGRVGVVSVLLSSVLVALTCIVVALMK